MRSSGASPMPAATADPTSPPRRRLPPSRTVPGGRLAGAVDGLEDLRAARAHEAGQPDDLAGADGEVHAVEVPGQAEALHLEQRGLARRGGADPALREDVLDGPAGHQRDDLAGRGVAGREPGGDGAPVLEDGDPVADLADLLEPVGDVDDGDVLGGEVADDAEEALDLLVVQHGRGLVHDDQLRVLRERPRHADHLLLRRRQGTDLGGGPDLGVAEPGEQLSRRPLGRGRPGDPEPGGLPAEEDVVGDGQAGAPGRVPGRSSRCRVSWRPAGRTARPARRARRSCPRRAGGLRRAP